MTRTIWTTTRGLYLVALQIAIANFVVLGLAGAGGGLGLGLGLGRAPRHFQGSRVGRLGVALRKALGTSPLHRLGGGAD